jgi:CheY-like chemotaxis protein
VDRNSGKSILIVEDEMVSCLFLTHCVKRMGHRVTGTASTGADAIEQALALRPDLVIMDVGLKGGMNGAQAADVIYRRRKIPILFVSAYTHEEICRHTDLPEIFDYLPKPIVAEQLELKLRAMLERGEE